MKAPFRRLQTFCAIFIFLALGLSLVWGTTFYNRIVIYRNRDQYQSRSFIVADAVYTSDTENGDYYWLEGTIDGQQERLVPDRRSSFVLRSKRELLFKYPRGTPVPVLFNPEAGKTLIQHESLRVLEATPDFWENEARLRLKWACFVFPPVPIALAIYLGVRLMNRRREQAGGAISSSPRTPG